MATSPSGIRAGRAFVELFAADGPLTASLAKWENKLAGWSDRVTAAGRVALTASAAILAPLAAATANFVASGSQLDDIAQRTGANAEALSVLGYAAGRTGSSLEAVEKALLKTQKAAAEAAAGSKGAEETLAAVGLTAADLAGLSADQQFSRIADALNGIADPASKTAAALELWGKSGAELIPLATELGDLEAEAKRLGITMDGAAVAAAAALGDSFDRLKAAGGGVTNQIGAALAPALTAAIDALTNATAQTAAWIREHQTAVTVAAAAAVAVGSFGAALVTTGLALKTVATSLAAVRTATTAAAAAWTTLAPLLAALASPVAIWGAALLAVIALLARFTATGQAATAALTDAFGALAATVGQTVGGIADALASGDVSRAAKILWAGLDLAWTQGTGGLATLWRQFLAKIVSLAETAVNALAEPFAQLTGLDLTANFADAWQREAEATRDATADAVAAAQDELDKLTAKREETTPERRRRPAPGDTTGLNLAATAAAATKTGSNPFVNATTFEGFKAVLASLRPRQDPIVSELKQIRQNTQATATEGKKTREALEDFTVGEID